MERVFADHHRPVRGQRGITKAIMLLSLRLFLSMSGCAGGLMGAISRNETERARQLGANGADVNVKNWFGMTPLGLAANRGNAEIVSEVIAAGADVNAKNGPFGDTALMLAAINGYTGVVRQLIAAGADVNEQNNYGGTALATAIRHSHSDIIQELRRAGATN